MADTALWARRVADWRASGETFALHCKGKAFSASALRYWAGRLGKEEEAPPGDPGAPPGPAAGAKAPSSGPSAPVVPEVRMARVQRTAAPPVVSGQARRPTAPPSDPTIVVELGQARVSVRPGFDRATLAAVIELLAARGAGR